MPDDTNQLSRRNFVTSTGVLAASALVPMELSAATAQLAPKEHEVFAQYIGNRVRISSENLSTSARIASVTPMGPEQDTPPGVRSQAFEVVLEASPQESQLDAQNVRMRHASLGSFDLRLTACDKDACSGRMRAIFN